MVRNKIVCSVACLLIVGMHTSLIASRIGSSVSKYSLLKEAVSKNNFDQALKLLKEDSGLARYRGEDGKTILHEAAKSADKKIINMLLDCGSSIDAFDGSKLTPMYYAVCEGREEIVAFFLENGASPNRSKVGKSHATTLHRAAINTPVSEPLVALLIKKGAAMFATDAWGFLPSEYAEKRGNHSLAALISPKIKRAEFYSTIKDAIVANDFDVVTTLLPKNKEIVKYRDENSKTLLHEAAKIGDVKTLQFLLDHGSDIDALDANGASPLYHAVCKNNLEAVKCLLENKADPMSSKVGKNNATTLHRAASNSPENVELVEVLVKNELNKASLKAKDKNGKTPLDYAKSAGNSKITDYITKENLYESYVSELFAPFSMFQAGMPRKNK